MAEKHPSINARSRDWNMGLHWGAASLQELLPQHLWDRIQSVQVDPSTPTAASDSLNFFNAKSGELMASIPVNYFYRLRRRKLRELMEDDVNVCYGKRLGGLDYASDGSLATATFEDGSSISAQLVIGTDGARSTLRSTLLGPEDGNLRQLPYCATFVQARYSADRARFLRTLHPLYFAGINPSNYFSFFGMHDVEDPERPETWTFFFYISWYSPLEEQERTTNWTNAQRLKQTKEAAQFFTDPWKSAFDWLEDDHPVWYMSLSDYDPSAPNHRWDNHDGRVTMAGDAAHAMTYQRGQGLNHSLTDAGNLVRAIQDFTSGKSSRADAISAYEQEMIGRAGGEVRLSSLNTEMMHNWQKVQESPIMQNGMKKYQQN